MQVHGQSKQSRQETVWSTSASLSCTTPSLFAPFTAFLCGSRMRKKKTQTQSRPHSPCTSLMGSQCDAGTRTGSGGEQMACSRSTLTLRNWKFIFFSLPRGEVLMTRRVNCQLQRLKGGFHRMERGLVLTWRTHDMTNHQPTPRESSVK